MNKNSVKDLPSLLRSLKSKQIDLTLAFLISLEHKQLLLQMSKVMPLYIP